MITELFQIVVFILMIPLLSYCVIIGLEALTHKLIELVNTIRYDTKALGVKEAGSRIVLESYWLENEEQRNVAKVVGEMLEKDPTFNGERLRKLVAENKEKNK